MNIPKKVATPVKVDPTLYDEFKVLGVRYKLTLQGLIEKTIYRYARDDFYRDNMNIFHVPPYSDVPLLTNMTSSWTSGSTTTATLVQ